MGVRINDLTEECDMGEAPAAHDDNGDKHELLLAQLRELYGRAAYTHKTHEKQADICYGKHRKQRLWLVGLTAVSSGTFVASLLGIVFSEQWASVVTSFIAVLVSGVTLASQNFRHGEDTQKHRDVAARVWNLREAYLSLIVDLQSDSYPLEQIRKRRDQLQSQAFEIYGDAPRTTPKAYKAAQGALQNKEDLTFSEKEIDALLPTKLRKADGGGSEDK